MVWGLGPGDIIRGVEICVWLYQHCFSPGVALCSEYIEFGRDVKILERVLQSLDQYLRDSRGVYHDAYLWTEPNLGAESMELLGDFCRTLEECRSFLSTHSSFEWNSGCINRVRWGTSVEPRVQHFRDRIRIHTLKVNLLTNVLHLGQGNTVAQDVSEILEIVRREQDAQLALHAVPTQLADRFRTALLEEASNSARNTPMLDLKEGFDAMFWHFNHSSYVSNGNDQTLDQYLSLLKAHFLLEELKSCQAFRSARPGSQWRRAILEIGQRIRAEYERDLQPYDEADLLNRDASYQIWIPFQSQIPDNTPDVQRIKLCEELQIKARPGFARSRVALYRTGPSNIDLVEENFEESSDRPDRLARSIHIRSDCLIPWYAQLAESRGLQIGLRSGGEANDPDNSRSTIYEFQSLDDVKRFQQAFLGYRVAFDVPNNVRWVLDRKSSRPWKVEPLRGHGRLQVWQWEPLAVAPSSQVTPNSRSSLSDPVSGDTGMSRAMQSLDTTYTTIVAKDNRTETVAAAVPYPPKLALFTKIEDRFALISVDLKSNHLVDPTSCKCSHSPLDCCRAVLENKSTIGASAKYFEAHKFVTDRKRIDQWNLMIFARPASEDRRVHTLYTNPKVVESFQSNYLAIDFVDVSEREKFGLAMHKIMTMKKASDQSVGANDRRMAIESDRPRRSSQHFQRPTSPVHLSRSSTSRMQRGSLGPPVIPPHQELPSLDETILSRP